MFQNCFRGLLYASTILLALVVAGCGKNDPKQLADKAEKAVEQFLDAWSRGERPDTFADPDRPIQGNDPDWKAGYRLLSFLNTETKQNPEMPDRVRCRVSLSLQDAKGKRWDKEVVYEVQVGMNSVINRAAP
jgi:hypothetical protein